MNNYEMCFPQFVTLREKPEIAEKASEWFHSSLCLWKLTGEEELQGGFCIWQWKICGPKVFRRCI